jgi:hypothetical protein
MTKEVGCPYCIAAGFNVRKMVRNSEGEYVCPNCGHVEQPGRGDSCGCTRCRLKVASKDDIIQKAKTSSSRKHFVWSV